MYCSACDRYSQGGKGRTVDSIFCWIAEWLTPRFVSPLVVQAQGDRLSCELSGRVLVALCPPSGLHSVCGTAGSMFFFSFSPHHSCTRTCSFCTLLIYLSFIDIQVFISCPSIDRASNQQMGEARQLSSCR